MTRFNAYSQTFIIRFWSEPREAEGAASEWRGMIEHVPTGERHYFQRIDEIPEIIEPFLKGPARILHKRRPIWKRLVQAISQKGKRSS